MGDKARFDRTKNQWLDSGDNPELTFDKSKNQWIDTSEASVNITEGAQMRKNKKHKKMDHY